ncbi:aminotransferase class I/II-fold pyridoxal phosphate-dependent enzyme [Saccharopolyspora elongata]|uniref:Aminotransferase class I/II-fold pyridoxal phosphate-dependent enzyme n=1 Tax=Saccharopolyspora elongata TaxID=2530387 RepID=A0A4R4Y724_9PSEU|nr:aminotransferase class I/II-fold pyridoxal phosphate-dependent enzyme [Saccharopolyspora elongata]TDD38802.1 aminotransferase class I/II-fold pyridoxal phosphate-dependent enzyme [Saccharopolyspora elongata]
MTNEAVDRAPITGASAGEISDSVRNLVSTGRLQPGDSVPPIRDLALELGVHRNTVAAAYRMLVAAGVAETRGRRGTVITSLPHLEGETAVNTELADLSSGNPDPALLPDAGAALSQIDYRMQMYGSPAVDPRLARWARTSLTPELDSSFEISVTHGAVDAVERLLTAHLTRGDVVAVEDPCFYASEGTVRLNGFRAAPVSVDTEGLEPEALRAALEAGARAAIVTPRAHNPTGVSITPQRAREIRSVLQRYPHVLVIEDDHFSAISRHPYNRVTPATAQRWALVRSVAKFLGPDMRVAVVASDRGTADRLGSRLRPGATWVSHLLQQLVANLLESDFVTRQLDHARRTYAERVDDLREELTKVGVDTPFPTDGFNVWVPVPHGSSAVVAALRDAGWSVRDGSSFQTPTSTTPDGVRITASRLTHTQAREFAQCLAMARESVTR